MKTRFLIIIGIAIVGGIFSMFYGISQFNYYQDLKQLEEWRDIRESIMSEIREKKINNQTRPTASIMSEEERCAWYFDMAMNEFVKEQEKYNDSPDVTLEILSADQIVSTSEQFATWRSSVGGCAFSIPEWADLSDYKNWIWENIGPTFKIKGLSSYIKVNEPIFITVEKIGYHMCNSWDARIIDLANNSTTWEKENHSLCVATDHPTQKRFQYTISNDINPIVISNVGNYTFQIEIGHAYLEKDFSVMEYEGFVVYHDFDS